ncbi:MAG: hypothetical protein B7Y47_04985 [Sphingomonas sp. 28-63-12]|nr:MAG: hypothetical protein B7Y47_04985 [Sphingomonas sp. 28-63-12]
MAITRPGTIDAAAQPAAPRRTARDEFLVSRGMIEDQGKKVGARRCGQSIEPQATPGRSAVKEAVMGADRDRQWTERPCLHAGLFKAKRAPRSGHCL